MKLGPINLPMFIAALLFLLFAGPAASGVSDDDTASESPVRSGTKKTASKPLTPRDVKDLRLPDSTISANLREAFGATKIPNAVSLTAVVRDGVVTLRGKVGSIAERNLFDAAARTSPGVKGVRNYLAVRNPSKDVWPEFDKRSAADVVSDAKILDDVKKRVASSSLVRMADVRLEVHLGVVVVSGPIQSAEARDKLRDIILYAPKVRAVVNNTWPAEP